MRKTSGRRSAQILGGTRKGRSRRAERTHADSRDPGRMNPHLRGGGRHWFSLLADTRQRQRLSPLFHFGRRFSFPAVQENTSAGAQTLRPEPRGRTNCNSSPAVSVIAALVVFTRRTVPPRRSGSLRASGRLQDLRLSLVSVPLSRQRVNKPPR